MEKDEFPIPYDGNPSIGYGGISFFDVINLVHIYIYFYLSTLPS